MNIPENLKYSKDHEWVKIEGNKAWIGITDHAQESLGDIVFVELPEIGDEFEKDEEATNVESVKAAAPIFSPIGGKVVEVNADLEDQPELVNKTPYKAYIFVLEMNNPSEAEELLDAAGYKSIIEQEK